HRKGEEGRYTFDADAPFGLPYRPNPFTAHVTLAMSGGEEVVEALLVQYRYEGNIFSGEKRMDLLVAPALSVRVSPEIAIIPANSIAARSVRQPADKAKAPAASREIRVTVVNDTPSAAEPIVKLDLPSGWTAAPPQVSVKLSRQDEAQTVRFEVKPPPNAVAGEYRIRAS